MQEKYFFESSKTDSYVELYREGKFVWIEKYYLDTCEEDNIKEFYDILVKAFDTAKKRGGDVHSQYVKKEDWDRIKSDDRWDLISVCNDEINYIECDIDDAPKCIIEGFVDE